MASSHGNASSSSAAAQNEEINPGEFVLRALFTEFTVLAERKIERLMKEPVVSVTFHSSLFGKIDFILLLYKNQFCTY